MCGYSIATCTAIIIITSSIIFVALGSLFVYNRASSSSPSPQPSPPLLLLLVLWIWRRGVPSTNIALVHTCYSRSYSNATWRRNVIVNTHWQNRLVSQSSSKLHIQSQNCTVRPLSSIVYIHTHTLYHCVLLA